MDDNAIFEEDFTFYQPCSIEAEQCVLGAILKDNSKLPDLREVLTSADFYDVRHVELFKMIEQLDDDKKPIDVMIVIQTMQANNKLEFIGGLPYLAEMAQNALSTNALAYAQIVKNKSIERNVLRLADKMREIITVETGNSEDRVNNALSLAANFDLSDKKEKTTNEIMQNLITDFERRAESEDKINGQRTGFIKLDEQLNGLQKKDLIILAARPSLGKTSVVLNIAENIALHGKNPVLFFSLEMSAEQLLGKVLCSIGGINFKNYRDANLSNEEYANLSMAAIKFKSGNLIIDDRPALTLNQIRAKAIREKRRLGHLALIVIDYLTLIKTPNKNNRTQEVGELSRGLKALAKELDCPVIALSQLSRKVEERGDKRPMMSDLRDSGEIEQDADVIIFLYRDDVYKMKTETNYSPTNIAELIVSKNRQGEIGTVHVQADLAHSRFLNLTNFEFKPQEEQKPQKQYRKNPYDDLDN